MIEIKLSTEEKVKATISPMTPGSKPAPVDGEASWTVTAGDATVEVLEGGFSAFLVSGDTASESKIMVSVDADMGEGVQTVSQEVSLVCSLPSATTLGFSTEAPVLK